MAISKKIREQVFNKYGGRCAYCGCELSDKWQVDHAISKQYWFYVNSSDPKFVDDIDNLMPACTPCNHYKRSHCVNDIGGSHVGFRTYMMKFHIRLGKLPKKSKREKTEKTKTYMWNIADRYGITPEKPFTGKFYFETDQNKK